LPLRLCTIGLFGFQVFGDFLNDFVLFYSSLILLLSESSLYDLYSFLLACVNCTNGFHCNIFMHAYNVLQSNSYLITLFYPSSHLLKRLPGFIVLFSYIGVKYFNQIHSSSPLLSPSYTPGIHYFSFSVWLILLNMMISTSIHFLANDIILLFFMVE
jgi:hypothetical protein